jgi:hypothetical protein
VGLSFHYRGKIKDPTSISQLKEKMLDLCKIMRWEHIPIEDDDLNGITLFPPGCEPVFLCFNSERELCSPVLLMHWIYPATFISVKTQFAGIEIHKVLIKLFKCLKRAYFTEFKMIDEGDYWNTLDEDVLKKQFDKYSFLLEAVGGQLENFRLENNETEEPLADRLEQFLNERFGKNA